MLRSLWRSLAWRGWVCELAETASLALGSLAAGSFDALVTDFRIEPFDGIELCRRARLAGFGGPMVLYSGYVTAKLRARALRTGVHAVLPKEEVADVLVQQVFSLCDLQRSSPGSTSAPHPAARLAGLLDLSCHEALLLSELVRATEPLMASVLIHRIWGRSGNRKLFDVTLGRLRIKLDGSGWSVPRPKRGGGYGLVRALDSPSASRSVRVVSSHNQGG